eukprot:IDg2405t1
MRYGSRCKGVVCCICLVAVYFARARCNSTLPYSEEKLYTEKRLLVCRGYDCLGYQKGGVMRSDRGISNMSYRLRDVVHGF